MTAGRWLGGSFQNTTGKTITVSVLLNGPNVCAQGYASSVEVTRLNILNDYKRDRFPGSTRRFLYGNDVVWKFHALVERNAIAVLLPIRGVEEQFIQRGIKLLLRRLGNMGWQW